MSAPLLLDLSHTSHTSARTGIQRVARSLWRELGESARAITYDPHQRTWRALDSWEKDNLAADSFSSKRGATWPLPARLRGYCRRLFSSTQSRLHASALEPHSGLLISEQEQRKAKTRKVEMITLRIIISKCTFIYFFFIPITLGHPVVAKQLHQT
ncbi:MAG: hypothetical protein WCQ44_02820, partial [Opitutaceae bacterium]